MENQNSKTSYQAIYAHIPALGKDIGFMHHYMPLYGNALNISLYVNRKFR